MTIRRVNGVLNQTFPLWELGACLYWRSFDPLHVQTPKGQGKATYSYVSGVGTLYPYYIFDPGRGKFFQVDPSVAAEFPPDGFMPPQRTNYFNDTQTDSRGFTVFETGLTHTHPVLATSHILDLSSTGLTVGLRMVNPTGGDLKIRRSDTTSAAESKAFQVLLHRSDGGAIDGNTASLWISDTTGGANKGTATTYRRIRDDGWWVLDMTLGTVPAAPNYYYGVVIKPGVTVDVEMPCIENFSASTPIATFGPPWIAANSVRYPHTLTIRRQDDANVGLEGWSNDGWTAALVVDLNPAAMTRVLGIAVNREEPTFATGDYERLSMSSSAQNFVSALYRNDGSGSASEFYLTTNRTKSVGMVRAFVTTWGRHKSNQRAKFYENGKLYDEDSEWTIPTATDPTVYQVGFRATSSSSFAACIQSVIVGRNFLGDGECRILSNWLKKQALSAWV